MKSRTALLGVLLVAAGPSPAGTITAVGSVTELSSVSQLTNVLGTADFDSLAPGTRVSTQYAVEGITFQTGALSSILAGVATPGSAELPEVGGFGAAFPSPIAGGGVQSGLAVIFAGVATFDPLLYVTQVGLTAASTAGGYLPQYLTAWGPDGTMLGQVTWSPSNDSAFVGIDTGSARIGMVAWGDDNLWASYAYSVVPTTTMTDTWIWSGRRVDITIPEPSTIVLLSSGLALLGPGPALLGLAGFAGLGAVRRKKLAV